MIVNKEFQGYTLNSYLFNMSCGLEMEKLKDFDKQLDEQAANLEKQIQQLETQLAALAIKESETDHEATAEVVPEASGD